MTIHDSLKNQGSGTIGEPLRLQDVQDNLTTRRLGHRLHYFSEIDSTNSYARQLARQGAVEGEVIVAEAQTHGRGRSGRTWESPPFLNLYCSILLRPKLPPVNAPQLTLMAAVALTETVGAFIADDAAIKWPNDILVGGKKLAGILTESSCHADQIDFVILGIGVNLNYPVLWMPETIRGTATSIMTLTQKSVSRELFLRRLIQDLDRCYGEFEEAGFGAIAPRWEASFGLRGKQVRVEMTEGVVVGTARGIDTDGALIVEDGQQKRRRIIAGDVVPADD
jgi:BirA family biotin operon repressor/biotin-[acetyl-CoA-carboxylase] ligase